MLTQSHIKKNIVAKLENSKIINIKAFIQGSVYCYCKNCNGWFAARDLFGGANYHWEGTPLYALYDWHFQNKSNNPVDMAGKDIGWILLDVIDGDKRRFDLDEGYTHKYKWTGEECNSNTVK